MTFLFEKKKNKKCNEIQFLARRNVYISRLAKNVLNETPTMCPIDVSRSFNLSSSFFHNLLLKTRAPTFKLEDI